jgi:hypothetical protein
MEFKCSKCQNSYEVTEEHAGMEFECSNCQATVSVPQDLFAKPTVNKPTVSKFNDPLSASPKDYVDFCPKCNSPLEANAIICIECGHNLKLGLNAKTVAKTKNVAKTAGKFGIAVTIATVTAIISALIWAGIAIGINMEIGYVAWGIGLAVGGSVILTTQERSFRLGLVAVLLSVFAIFLGKVIYVNYGLKDIFIKSLKSDPNALSDILFWEMTENNEFDQEFVKWVKEHENSLDDINNASEEMQEIFVSNSEKFNKKMSSLTSDDKKRLYEFGAAKAVNSIPINEKIKATCSGWDILWLILAVSSAWKMATGANES